MERPVVTVVRSPRNGMCGAVLRVRADGAHRGRYVRLLCCVQWVCGLWLMCWLLVPSQHQRCVAPNESRTHHVAKCCYGRPSACVQLTNCSDAFAPAFSYIHHANTQLWLWTIPHGCLRSATSRFTSRRASCGVFTSELRILAQLTEVELPNVCEVPHEARWGTLTQSAGCRELAVYKGLCAHMHP